MRIKVGMLYHLTFFISNKLWIYVICECGERIVTEVGNPTYNINQYLRTNVGCAYIFF